MSDFVLNDDDVVSIAPNRNFAKTSTSKVIDIKSAYINNWLGEYADWGKDGVVCQVLSIHGGGWRRGKLRFKMEFTPDPEPIKPASTDAVLGG